MKNLTFPIFSFLLWLTGCSDAATQRAAWDLEVGKAQGHGLVVDAKDSLAVVRTLEEGKLELWLAAPVVEIRLQADETAASRTWELVIHNATRNAVMDFSAGLVVEETAELLGTRKQFSVQWQNGARTGTLRIADPDAHIEEPFTVLVLSDIQEEMDRAGDLFERMNQVLHARFTVSAGDITDNGKSWEYRKFREKLRELDIPMYSTPGNHDVSIGPDMLWHLNLGPHSLNFSYKGAVFSLVDSADSTIAPVVMDRLDGWLEEARSRYHVFVTHVPLVDPNGIRNGSFSSRKEAARLIARLAAGHVNLAVYGHIHTYFRFSHGGMDAVISGGGGGWPMRMDGISRHFLVLDIDPVTHTHTIRPVEVGE